MIQACIYKDRPAIAVSCEGFKALFLPEDGAKLASFQTKSGDELLAQAGSDKYRRLGADTGYVQSECSAFDDMFPTIDPCVINGMQYSDHGEVCRREHKTETDGERVTFICELEKLNITYKKTAFAQDGALQIKYSIENRNSFEFPYVWAGHIMFRGEEGAYIVSDLEENAEKRFMFGKPLSAERAHILEKCGENKEYKYYYTKESTPLKCGIVYPQSKKQISVEFDNDTVKYLGVWMNPGDLNGMYNLALEPCTALYDSPLSAQKANASSYIGAGATVEFTLKMKYKEV
ncbi:MAG: hypothetical protein PUC05_01335 [Firmicutes bacterium]|nr:hypothetical protein [Bacillota bacterium]